MPSMTAEPVHDAGLERAELQAVLASQLFVRSPTLAHLLSSLCEKKFAGETDQIKEYSVALDVFGRQESFDRTRIPSYECRRTACASDWLSTTAVMVPRIPCESQFP